MTESKPTPFIVGVLVLPPIIQFMDLLCVDRLNILNSSWLKTGPFPESLQKQGQDIRFHYISPDGPSSPANITTGTKISITDDFSSPAVQPGKLDLLYIPGALTFDPPSESVKEFIRGHFNATCAASGRPTDVFSVCASVLTVSHTGIFDGKTVTCPTMAVEMMGKSCPKAKWVDSPSVHDGNLWSAWSMKGLNEVIISYLNHQVEDVHRFPKELVDFANSL